MYKLVQKWHLGNKPSKQDGKTGRGTHITRDMYFPGRGTYITRDMCFPGRGTHITGDKIKTYHH